MCADFGDCCPDYQEVCGTAFADECEDREASVSNQAGKKLRSQLNVGGRSLTLTHKEVNMLSGMTLLSGLSIRI